MIINHVLRPFGSQETKTIQTNDMTSPSGGYTQSYADQQGKDYAEYRATEQLGGTWYWVESFYEVQPKVACLQ